MAPTTEDKVKKTAILAALIFSGAGLVHATNGDNLIGVGPTSRAMGGTGIATPQDAISAIFSNPAALSQLQGSQFNFAGTDFAPKVKAKVVGSSFGDWQATSQDAVYAVPAIGVATPVNDKINFGIAAYGVSGMGVDYRNKDTSPNQTNTKVSVMKFVPALSYKQGAFSYGLGLDIDYQAADFGAGLSHNYAVGARLGAGYEYGSWNFGLTYVTPQNVDHKRIYDFDGSGGPTMTFDKTFENLKLENPAQYGAGVAYKGLDKWLFTADVKYIDWANAKGYKDFDWESQTVYAVGVQNRTTDKLTLRAGWNYGKNPVKKHDNFDLTPTATTGVQGAKMSTFGYEYFRIIGFPGVVENHFTVGAGYEFSPKFALNLGYMYAPEKTISETSGPVTLRSKLSEQSVDLGLTFKF